MKKSAYVISKKAVADLEEIWVYMAAHWSVEQADRYYHLLIEEILYICKNNQAGKSMEHIRPGYRAAKVKSHLIFYRKSADGIIEVIRILHERMDMEDRLGGKG
ncbi:MAG: type II toxin-antitoxin system RelE/ParE family toxin [Sphingobacteriales bacterium]|nr:type II toxin-antitoxin system RelE/ParE family toxin [Sphingobacteriales bacterium]